MLRLKMNRGESAKECFMEALALDVKCYEAFDQLISGEMMTADEGKFPSHWAYSYIVTLGRMGICPGFGI